MTVVMLEPVSKQYFRNQERTCCSVGLFGAKLSLLITKWSGQKGKERGKRGKRKGRGQENKLWHAMG
jgi:hypothetical protein